MEATQLLELEVRELIRARGIDPAGQPDEVRALVATAVAHYDARSMQAPLPMLDDMASTQQAVFDARSEEHTSELQSRGHLVCRLLLEKKKDKYKHIAKREDVPA